MLPRTQLSFSKAKLWVLFRIINTGKNKQLSFFFLPLRWHEAQSPVVRIRGVNGIWKRGMQLEMLSQRQAYCAASSIKASLPTTLCHYSPALASTRYSDTLFQPLSSSHKCLLISGGRIQSWQESLNILSFFIKVEDNMEWICWFPLD